MTPDQKIRICKNTRAWAQKSLNQVIQKILAGNLTPSEVKIRDLWLTELRKNDAIFPDGWYSPPPHGIGLLIGTDNDGPQSRLNYKSFRPEKMWPRKDIRLNTTNGLIYAYCSPVDKQTGIIGDFGVTLYFGQKPEITRHLALCHQIVQQVSDYTQPGLTFSQVAAQLKKLIVSHGLNNEIEARTSPSAADDVGHSIPFILEQMTATEKAILTQGSPAERNKMISEKRIFARGGIDQVIEKGMAFTIEPRPKVTDNPAIPMVSFHSICAIYENGEKELITGFDELFKLAGMQYML